MERKRHAKYRPKFNMRFVHHRRRIILGAFSARGATSHGWRLGS
ncbi:hypothetical protein ABHW52_06775 [Pediococcus pentosaceus]